MLRRAATALTILLAGAAALLLGFALAGPNHAAAVPGDTTTGNCLVVNCSSTSTIPQATTPQTSAATTTAPPRTAPPTTAPRVTQSPVRTFTPRTTIAAPTTTATTLPSIVGGNLPVTPSTVPFATKQQSSHVSPAFAALSGAGLFVALVIVVVRFITSRPPS